MLGFSPLAKAPLASIDAGTLLAALAATEAQDTVAVNVAITSTIALAISDMEATTDIEAFIASVTSVQWPVSPDAQTPVAPAQ